MDFLSVGHNITLSVFGIFCIVKNVESITTGYDSEEFDENFLQRGIKLFVSAAETTHISVGEMFALLHLVNGDPSNLVSTTENETDGL